MVSIAPITYTDNNKKANRLINATPVIAGLSAVALTKGRLSQKVASGALTTLSWGLAFGAIDLANKIENKFLQKSQKARNFVQNNPLISVAASLGIAFGAIAASDGLLTKGLSKIKLSFKNARKVANFMQNVDNSKLATTGMKKVSELASHLPNSVKSGGKLALAYAPMLAMLTSIGMKMSNKNN